ncbi:MAG: hypothetical protein AAFV47_07025 [Pseudomonadota bacterium]
MRVLVLCLVVASVSACAGPGRCENRTDYQGVQETPPIRIPDAEDGLPTESRLEIPVASTPPDVSSECLEKPPRFATDE